MPAQWSMGNLSILLAEDNRANQEIAAAMLRRLGHRVAIVPDGAAALHAARLQRYDLILMDMMMPGMDGLAAARAIRALPGADGQVPIIALTANALPEHAAACRAAGMNDFVAKPFAKRDLVAALERLAAAPSPIAGAAASTPRPASDVVLDRAMFDRLAAEIGADLVPRIVALFLAESDESLRRIDAAAQAGDRATIARGAHALKSSAANLGLVEISALARQIEQDAPHLAAERLEADIAALAAALARARKVLPA